MNEEELHFKMMTLGLIGMLTGKVNPKTLKVDILRDTMDLVRDMETFVEEYKGSEMVKLPVMLVVQNLKKNVAQELEEEAKHKC